MTSKDKDGILKLLISKGGMSKAELGRDLVIQPHSVERGIRDLRQDGYKIGYIRSSNIYQLILPEAVKKDPLEHELENQIRKLGLTPEDIKAVLKNLRDLEPRKYKPVKVKFSNTKVKFGVITDLHGGHSCYRPDILTHACENFRRQDVDFVFNCGDTIEGMSNRDGHIYELDILGVDPQIDFMAEQFEQFAEAGFDIHSIEADGSHTGWSRSKSNQGVNTPKNLERLSAPYKFLGWNEQDFILSNGIKTRLRHPASGTAYAISYKMQKYLESLGGGDKPHMVFNGHYHKHLKMFHRNIHAFECGTLENQTPYMARLGTPAHVGYQIIEITIAEADDQQTQTKGFRHLYDEEELKQLEDLGVTIYNEYYISSVKSEFIPFYD